MDGFALVDTPRDGVENMALDQLMLEVAATTSKPLLRVYQWKQPTVSLGYFQKFADYVGHSCSAAGCVVRRATGGGAIVHHHDWTYSLAIPQKSIGGQGRIGASMPVYECAHAAVVDELQAIGLAAEQSDGLTSSDNGRTAFLCFERRSKGDVIVGDHKVLGSAQRRRDGGLLQHGSLLLQASRYTPTLLGVRELLAGITIGNQVSNPKISRFAHESAWLMRVIKPAVESVLGCRFAEVSSPEALLGIDVQESCQNSLFTTNAWLHRA